MGRALAARNMTLSERLDAAWERLLAKGELEAINGRIQLSRQRAVGIRGDAPLGGPISAPYPLPPPPSRPTIIAAAIASGDHVRVGTEDNPYNIDGKIVPTHELVAEAAAIARAIGRPVATVSETRRMLGLA